MPRRNVLAKVLLGLGAMTFLAAIAYDAWVLWFVLGLSSFGGEIHWPNLTMVLSIVALAGAAPAAAGYALLRRRKRDEPVDRASLNPP